MSNKQDKIPISNQKNINNINLEHLSSSSASDEDDNQINLSETKNDILKAFDERINKNKEEFKQIT